MKNLISGFLLTILASAGAQAKSVIFCSQERPSDSGWAKMMGGKKYQSLEGMAFVFYPDNGYVEWVGGPVSLEAVERQSDLFITRITGSVSQKERFKDLDIKQNSRVITFQMMLENRREDVGDLSITFPNSSPSLRSPIGSAIWSNGSDKMTLEYCTTSVL